MTSSALLVALCTAGILALSACLTFEGARRIRTPGGLRRIWPLALGVLLWSAFGGIGLYNYFILPPDFSITSKAGSRRVDPSLSPIDRERVGLFLAKSEFVDSGRITSYVDANGTSRTYSPIQEDIEFRDTAQKLARVVATIRAEGLARALWFFGAGGFAFVLGLMMARARGLTWRSTARARVAFVRRSGGRAPVNSIVRARCKWFSA